MIIWLVYVLLNLPELFADISGPHLVQKERSGHMPPVAGYRKQESSCSAKCGTI